MAEKKLSELIREGAKLRPQGFEGYVDFQDGQICTCAIGAAYEAAIGKLPKYPEFFETDTPLEFLDLINAKTNPDAACRECGDYYGHIKDTVTHLNDHHHWTREKIADHIAGLGY